MLTWAETQKLIASRQLHKLRRSPAQSEEYHRAKEYFAKKYGGTAQFVISERLKWSGEAATPTGDAFLANNQDIKILRNDFSYDFEPGMRHFVVWSKAPIPCGSDEFPTEEAQQLINLFLKKQFSERAGVPDADIQWFKNTLALQSIPSVSHFHVLVRNCDQQLESRILQPLS